MLLDSAVEKICDVRVFFRLGDAQLGLARLAHHLAENVVPVLPARKLNGDRVGLVVLRERHVMDLRPDLAIETIEILVKKRLRKLARAVGAKVEKESQCRHRALAARWRGRKSAAA